MQNYEAMFIVKPDLSEAEKKSLFTQINDTVVKNSGNVQQANVWSEKRKLCFPINKHKEGIYYLMNFAIEQAEIVKINHSYKLNENILRVLITKAEVK